MFGVTLMMYQLSKMDIKAIGKLLGPRFDAVAGNGARALNELRLAPEAAILDIGTGNGNFVLWRGTILG
jgi:methylase of polypeptide subunit release factors